MRILLPLVMSSLVPLIAAEQLTSHAVARASYGNSGNPWSIASTGVTRIQCEDYDIGGEGVGFHDSDAINQGGAYRTDGVDVGGAIDAGGGYNLGYVQPGEWMNYSITVPTAGVYTLKMRIARGIVGNSIVRLFSTASGAPVNLAGDISVPTSNGWQNWEDFAVTNLTLAAGDQVLRLEAVDGELNMNWIELSKNQDPLTGPDTDPDNSGSTSNNFARGDQQGDSSGGGCGLGNSLGLLLIVGMFGLQQMFRRR